MAIATEAALIDALAQRIRDPNSTAHSRSVVADVLTHCWRLVNGATNTETTSASVSFAASQPFVSLFASLPFSIRVIAVGTSTTQRLAPIDWRTLASHDPLWFRRTADRAEVWGMVGRDLLFVWPAPAIATTYSIRYVTADTISDTGAAFASSQLTAPILDLAEQVLLLRQRLLASMKPAAEQFQQQIQTRAIHE